MPELPEVETIAADLDALLRGKKISGVSLVNKSKVLKTPWAPFRRAVSGARIRRVYRRAKMLIIETSGGLIVFHLKMTGQLIYISKKATVAGGHPIVSTGLTVPNKHTCLVFELPGGARLYFNDLRKFGWVRLMTPAEFADVDKRSGLEPLGRDFTLAYFSAMLAARGGTTIKAVLLDQKKLVGLGNIYVDEALYESRIRPDRRVASLRANEIKALHAAIPKILKHSIKQRGTTFRNFTDPEGLKGNFMAFLKVYGRQNEPCRRCGRPLTKIRVAGRGTHFCAHCQK